MKPRVVTIVQPYLPAYRVPFFDELQTTLASRGVRLRVQIVDTKADRRPYDWSSAPYVYARRQRSLSRGRWELRLGGRVAGTDPSDVIVLPLASGDLRNYKSLAVKSNSKIALWGHGHAYTTEPNRIDAMLEVWQAKRAAHVFTYTPSGRDHLLTAGVQPQNITAVMNSTDTTTLSTALRTVDPASVSDFRERYGLRPGKVGIFIGRLDAVKKLPLAMETAALIARNVPEFRLLVAGDGPLRDQVLAEGEHVRWLGYADLRLKAIMGAVGSFMLIPGRIGLVATESFAMGTPIVTTLHDRHAPEFDYLIGGHNSLLAASRAQDLADAANRLLQDPRLQHSLSANCQRDAETYSVEAMSQTFGTKLLELLGFDPSAPIA